MHAQAHMHSLIHTFPFQTSALMREIEHAKAPHVSGAPIYYIQILEMFWEGMNEWKLSLRSH